MENKRPQTSGFTERSHSTLTPTSTPPTAGHVDLSVTSFPIHQQPALPTVKRKSRREHRQSNYKTGKWTREERLLFLKGVRAYGWGRWKEIGGTFLMTRSCIQINSHGQKVMGKIREQGIESIMKELEDSEKEGTAPPSPEHVRRHRARYLEQQQLLQPYAVLEADIAEHTFPTTSAAVTETSAAKSSDAIEHEQPTVQNTVASNDEVVAAIAMCTMGHASRSSTPSFYDI